MLEICLRGSSHVCVNGGPEEGCVCVSVFFEGMRALVCLSLSRCCRTQEAEVWVCGKAACRE